MQQVKRSLLVLSEGVFQQVQSVGEKYALQALFDILSWKNFTCSVLTNDI